MSRFVELQDLGIRRWGDVAGAVLLSDTWRDARDAVSDVLGVTLEESVPVLRMDVWSVGLVASLMPVVHDMGDQHAEDYSKAGPDHLDEYLDPEEAAAALGFPWTEVMRALGERYVSGQPVDLEELQTTGWFKRQFDLDDSDVVLVHLIKLGHLCGESRRRLVRLTEPRD